MFPPNILFIKVNESENMVKMLGLYWKNGTYIDMVTLPVKAHPAAHCLFTHAAVLYKLVN